MIAPGERSPFLEDEATEVRARALPASSSKMRAAAWHAAESQRLILEAEAEAEERASASFFAASPWMTLEACASHFNVSEETVRRWVAARGMPVERIGRVLRFEKGEAERWFKSSGISSRGVTGGCSRSVRKARPSGGKSAPPEP